jgi:hypothetical protein
MTKDTNGELIRENLIIKNIEKLGDKYCLIYLDYWNKEELIENWWESLQFFFSHSFMRGRKDKLSNEYYFFTIEVLKDLFAVNENELDISYKRLLEQKEYLDSGYILNFKSDKGIGKGNSIKHNNFKKDVAEKNPIIKRLITPTEVEVKWDNKAYIKKISLGNDADIMMVLDVLNFITSHISRKNIYDYLKDSIEKYGIKVPYNELIAIRSIADKIASFIIRDILLLNPEIKILFKDYKKAFPVDTWVIRIARKLGCKSENIDEVKEYLISRCDEFGINPFKFAAGLWFLGFRSLDILLENCLGEIKI